MAICFLISFTQAELPLKVRADQALSQLQAKIQSNDFVGALPWLEKTMVLESEGFKMPASMNFFAGQVYVKNGLNEKAVPPLKAYLDQPIPGKNFWEAVGLLAKASPTDGVNFLEGYLTKENPPYYQEALVLYTETEKIVKANKDREAKLLLAEEAARRAKADAELREKQEAKRARMSKVEQLELEAQPKEAELEVRLGALRGTMSDFRDGRSYKTIRIGSQVWMAENLNFSTAASSCYEDDTVNCAKSGRLYEWDAAKSACPDGWHLPSDDEWLVLAKDQRERVRDGGLALKSIAFKGTNEKGFHAVPGGLGDRFGKFASLDSGATYWSSSEKGETAAWARALRVQNDIFFRVSMVKQFKVSARCIKD